jgi:hypothetical protein
MMNDDANWILKREQLSIDQVEIFFLPLGESATRLANASERAFKDLPVVARLEHTRTPHRRKKRTAVPCRL